jgi:hypothetical protein
MKFMGLLGTTLRNLHTNKLENLEEFDKVLVVLDLPKLNHEDINHLHRSITANESEEVIVSQKKEVHDWMN